MCPLLSFGFRHKICRSLCKTDFDMKEIAKEEADYEHYKIPKFYTFPSKDAKERILYQNFVSVNADVKEMIKTILMFKVKT